MLVLFQLFYLVKGYISLLLESTALSSTAISGFPDFVNF